MTGKYRMSPAALRQRRMAAKKEKTEGRMTVARISRTNNDWARIEFGTVNRALNHLRAAGVSRMPSTKSEKEG